MIRFIKLFFICLVTSQSTVIYAQPWKFTDPITVKPSNKAGTFHHLESAGRRNIAVSGNTVGIVWEDDRDGTPRIYFSRKSIKANAFDHDIQISSQGEAYEPALVALQDDYFALAWEEQGQTYVRIAGPDKTGPAMQVGNKPATQVSMVYKDEHLLVALREQGERFGRIVLHKIHLANRLELSSGTYCPVDSSTPVNDQLYPVVATIGNRAVVAWEDRRHGHTVIMASQSKSGRVCDFEPPARISERPPGPKMPYGAGHGVARVALTNYGQSGLFAIWADKRDFQEGYDIYGSNKHGSAAFEANVRVQDDFGGNYRQWHSTISGQPDGRLVAAWTDEREGSMDVWFSWLEDGEWSDDLALPGASGAGVQYHPSIILDQSGALHATWIERDAVGGPTRIRYTSGIAE